MIRYTWAVCQDTGHFGVCYTGQDLLFPSDSYNRGSAFWLIVWRLAVSLPPRPPPFFFLLITQQLCPLRVCDVHSLSGFRDERPMGIYIGCCVIACLKKKMIHFNGLQCETCSWISIALLPMLAQLCSLRVWVKSIPSWQVHVPAGPGGWKWWGNTALCSSTDGSCINFLPLRSALYFQRIHRQSHLLLKMFLVKSFCCNFEQVFRECAFIFKGQHVNYLCLSWPQSCDLKRWAKWCS